MYPTPFTFPGTFAGDLERLREEFDAMFGALGRPAAIRAAAPGTFPSINVGNTPQSLDIYAFAPGLDASKVEVTVDGGVLTLAGERPPIQARDEGRVNVYSRERPSGPFRRAISLPDDADATKVAATYRDGVLHVSVARRDAPQPTRIAVQ